MYQRLSRVGVSLCVEAYLCYEALLVARAWLANDAEWHSVSASIDAL